MSQRGYGDPPYPPTDSGARQLSGSGSSRDLSAAYDRESAPIRTEARNQGSTDQGPSSGGGRRSEPDEARYEPPPSRSSRSRWSNPPPRRRRSNQASGYAPIIPSPTYRDDVGTDLDDPNVSGSSSQGWDDYGQPSEWDEGAGPATSSPRGNRLGGQLRAPRLRLGGASRPRTTRSIRTHVPTFRVPNVFTRVELFHDQIALALL